MSFEIERKFLVRNDDWRALATSQMSIRQAYLASDGKASIRVRTRGDGTATLTVKSRPVDLRRLELEYDIPILEAEALMQLRQGAVIEKVRHLVPYRDLNLTWEIDVFAGEKSWPGPCRDRVAPRASACRAAAVDRHGSHRPAAVLQQLAGAAPVLLVAAPRYTDADRAARLNGVRPVCGSRRSATTH